MNREIAQAHWDEFVKPLIELLLTWKTPAGQILHIELDHDKWMELGEYLYVMAMVHGGKHEREN